MKDEQVDLCGQINYAVEESFPVLAKEDAYSFACKGCGDCCRGREDIVLSGYDLYRIAQYLHLPMAVVIKMVCRHYNGTNSLMPVVRLQPRQNTCPFLHQNRCAIHTVAPLVCSLYPLGQQIALDGTVQYFAQTVHCGTKQMEGTLGDYLQKYDIAEREELDIAWAITCVTLARTLKQLAPKLTKQQLTKAQARIYQALYLQYDTQKPYQAQFEKNVLQITRYFERIAAACA